jgi:hypothetical protein
LLLPSGLPGPGREGFATWAGVPSSWRMLRNPRPDPARRQRPGGIGLFLPGPPEAACQGPCEQELGVRGHEEPEDHQRPWLLNRLAGSRRHQMRSAVRSTVKPRSASDKTAWPASRRHDLARPVARPASLEARRCSATRGQGDTKACERRQKAEAREAAMEAQQSGTSAMATVGRRPKSLDAQGLPEQHDGSRRSPILSFAGHSACPGLATPLRAQDPPPHGPAVGGPPTLLHPMGVRDSVTAIDDRSRIG